MAASSRSSLLLRFRTTTLLPGEKVRLATTDRRSRFSFDSESNLSYRSDDESCGFVDTRPADRFTARHCSKYGFKLAPGLVDILYRRHARSRHRRARKSAHAL